jgi:hypothetical protein
LYPIPPAKTKASGALEIAVNLGMLINVDATADHQYDAATFGAEQRPSGVSEDDRAPRMGIDRRTYLVTQRSRLGRGRRHYGA